MNEDKWVGINEKQFQWQLSLNNYNSDFIESHGSVKISSLEQNLISEKQCVGISILSACREKR